MIFSVTELGNFKRCRRMAMLTSKNGRHLTTMFTPLHLEVGTLMHRAQQLWLLNPDRPLTTHIMDAGVECQDAVRERYKERVGVEPSDGEMLETYDSIHTAMQMCENYQVKYGQPLPNEYRLLRPEQKIRVKIESSRRPCPECGGAGHVRDHSGEWGVCSFCDPNHPGTEVHYLEGRLDALIQHESHRIDILERKTYKSRPRLGSLTHNEQFINYILLVRHLGLNSHLGHCITYDGMWRREEPPRGRTFDDLFLRVIITHNEHEIAEAEAELPSLLNDMADVYNNRKHAGKYRRWQGCYDCKVESICAAMSRGENYESIISTEYIERTDDAEQEEVVSDE